MKSKKQIDLEKTVLKRLQGKSLELFKILLEDEEIHYLQEYANTVSIKRLQYNDHGPVHMLKVVLNSITILDLLNKANIKLSLESEKIGTFEDSKIAVLFASFIHDIGMSVGRANHENFGAILAIPIIERVLKKIYPDNFEKQVILKSLILECIIGHMGSSKIHSKEAGVILVADGCDMEKGRARIPLILLTESKVGDIHKYSSAAIQKVNIVKGDKKPIKINVIMKEQVGFFQVEEVLMGKISASPIKNYIELYATVVDGEPRRYL